MKLEDYEFYIRQRARLEDALTDIGETAVSKEVEGFMRNIQSRLDQRIQAAFCEARSGVEGLRQILNASEQKNREESP